MPVSVVAERGALDVHGITNEFLLEQPRFKAGLDFLLLRAASGEVPKELADWWTNFIESDPDIRQELISQRQRAQLKHGGGTSDAGGRRRRSRGGRGRKRRDDSNDGGTGDTGGSIE